MEIGYFCMITSAIVDIGLILGCYGRKYNKRGWSKNGLEIEFDWTWNYLIHRS
jgi:hypothetical protein